MKFSKAEAATVNWHEAWGAACSFCDAAAYSYCYTAKGHHMYSFHKARKDNYLLSQLFVITEELDLADALVGV